MVCGDGDDDGGGGAYDYIYVYTESQAIPYIIYIVVASFALVLALCIHLPTSSGLKFNGKSFATKVPNREMYKRNRLASSTGSVNFSRKLYCLPFR